MFCGGFYSRSGGEESENGALRVEFCKAAGLRGSSLFTGMR